MPPEAFDGWLGWIAARVMARGNADMEAQAIERLAPAPDHAVLELGFGPGVGIALLDARVPGGRVAGVDPSGEMLRVAERRNREAIRAQRVELVRAAASALPWPDASFDGAIAVNCAQLWDPFVDSAREIARVLRPGAQLVTLTHAWAARRHAPSEAAWLAYARAGLAAAGFTAVQDWRGRARTGATLGLAAERARR